MFFLFLLCFGTLVLAVVGLVIYTAYRTIWPQIGKGKLGYLSPSLLRTKPILIDSDGAFDIEGLKVLEQNPGKARFDLMGESGPLSRIFYKSDLYVDPFNVAGGSGTLKLFTRKAKMTNTMNEIDGKKIAEILENKAPKEQRKILTDIIAKLQSELRDNIARADDFEQKYKDVNSKKNKISAELDNLRARFDSELDKEKDRLQRAEEARQKGKAWKDRG